MFRYYIEVRNTHKDKVPTERDKKKATLVNMNDILRKQNKKEYEGDFRCWGENHKIESDLSSNN
jgi:DNA mismatch repair protein MutS